MNYLEIINKGKIDRYYGISEDNCEDIFLNPEEYIRSYFGQGNKLEMLLTNGTNILLDKKRCTHMCSLYSLGTIISRRMHLDILIENKYRNVLPRALQNNQLYNNSFLYYWFLVSLFHDVGYGAENEPRIRFDVLNFNKSQRFFVQELLSNKLKNRDDAKRIFEIYRYKKFDMDFNYRISRSGNLYISKKYNPYVINHYYPAWNYKWYYSANNNRISKTPIEDRQNENFEHGVLGGRLLFNNALMAMKCSIAYYNTADGQYFFGDGMKAWFPEQIDIFRDLGMIVCTHNIWKKSFNTLGTLERFTRISIKNPLLFLLCLCDTIDPYKHLMKQKIDVSQIKESLNKIIFEVDAHKIIIQKPTNNANKLIDEWYSQLKSSLENFMEIRANYGTNKLTIQWD